MTPNHTSILQNQYHVDTSVSDRLVGMIMGVSPESSEVYYHNINYQLRQRLGGLHSAHIINESFNFAEIDALMRLGESGWQEITAQMDRAVRTFKSAGAKAVAVCSNTMHRVVEPICQNLDIPLIHIGDAVAAAMRQQGNLRVGLLGTSETMNGQFLIDHLSQFGAKIITPDVYYHEEIDRIIFQELCCGDRRASSCHYLINIIQKMRLDSNIDGVILGCTELPLLLTFQEQSKFRAQYCNSQPFVFYDSTVCLL